MDMTRRKQVKRNWSFENLLIPIFQKGILVYESPSIHRIRDYTIEQLNKFHAGIKRFVNPHSYPVGLEKSLHDYKLDLILQLREKNNQN